MTETAKKNPKWTEDEVAKVHEVYDPAKPETVIDLANALGRSKRSVIGKLVSEGLYVVPAKPEPKPKDEGPTKAEILKALGAKIDTDGADGATKPFLTRVAGALGITVETSEAA